MKRWGTIALLALGMATPAQALSLSDLNGLWGGACGNTQVTSIFNIKGACQLYEALKPGFNAGKFLDYAKGTMLTSVLNGALNGVGDATNNAFLNNLSNTLGDAANKIREAYNLPYKLVDDIAKGVWGGTYKLVYDNFSLAYSSIASGASTAISSSYSPLSLSVTNPLSEQLAKTLDTATHNAVDGMNIINQGLGTLEAAKNSIVRNAQMGFPAETPMAVRVCKLEIRRNNTSDTFPGISKTTDCIGGNTPPTEPAPKVTQGQVEEYINHYKATEAELTQKLANLAKKSRKSFRFILPPRGVLSPRSGDALG